MLENRLLSYAYARDFSVLACRDLNDSAACVELAVSTETKPAAIAEVGRRFGRVKLNVMPHADLLEMIARTYAGSGGDAADVVGEVESDLDLAKLMLDMPAIEDLLESADDAPVIRMINALLTQALRDGASDIHIEPFEQISIVRFRIDGSLRDVVRPKKAIHASLVSRIKIMAQLDIAEKRLPQDGRITLRIGGKPVDVRVSTLPTGHGERAVLRLLDKEAGRLDLSTLGMSPDVLPQFDKLIAQPHGIVLVTGPTGSGKTTTLYAALSRLNAGKTNILTVEDPIEYELAGVGQTQVNARIDMTFAKALRAILRQDPDVIMIGEIRDLETAQIAVQASLTGHLVLATLHTNDSAAAVTRLLDMGIEPFLLSSSLLGVIAQRLVRKLCTRCKRFDGQDWHSVGCEHCGHTGYQGRVGVYELLLTTEEIRSQIHHQASEAEVRTVAQRDGMKTMREDGDRWLTAGVTTREELLRVTKE
ncbi:type II secretion system ATPase GspE [Undibacterium sp. RTI2.1]|uniref:type II secretion system ATPase GspE n=1 Tax=unclassified Undibacterium TaxID=2630295 RepID=UPI002AB444DB|nr:MULTISPECIES: type II secretion system ATPase GspE [unclassified Undibacterium]MDY7538057.1 type II secretion system ATPase GspE [Undibacterium sp. 5I1]MEB0032540.1 type II secretion system ATPase GspE [Undibacterium sp. RTI2.1]MEB0117879.1 type II secretion system ATPase GspE [Undibacterium sp. RTI2.2]MEB0231656.1 type II secretion system ATPase GspE [Undibacterium sp. 10I3]MEB0258667.1 type II secretion system ATPase GspE [Undibacterium sp. 5I1]